MRASANEILKGVKPIFNMVPSKIELVCQLANLAYSGVRAGLALIGDPHAPERSDRLSARKHRDRTARSVRDTTDSNNSRTVRLDFRKIRTG